MAATFDFTLSGDHGQAQQLVLGALAGIGHQAELRPDGTFSITRGSGTATFWLGAMSGKNFHTRYTLVFHPSEAGMIATFTRAGSLGAIKGGAIGHAKTTNTFNEAARAIDAATRGAGILVSVGERD
jgi:hypothetical protein